MKFTVAGSRIICSRIDQTVEAGEKYRNVVEFDSHVESVPPHVAAKLTAGEIGELEQFLADRKRIEADPAGINMLEALPELVEEVTDVLNSAERLNDSLYDRLTESVMRLADSLREVRPKRTSKVKPIRGMRSTEVLKQRLDNIRREL